MSIVRIVRSLLLCCGCVLVLIIGFLIVYFYHDFSLSVVHQVSVIFETGTLIRNVAVALFAMSVWYSQHRTNKTAEYLNTLRIGEDELAVLRLLVQLRDTNALDKIRGRVEEKYLEAIRKSIEKILFIEKIRNFSIIFFVIGVVIEFLAIISQCLS